MDLRKSGAITFPGPYGEYRRKRDAAKRAASNRPNVVVSAPAKAWSPRDLSKEIERLERAVRESEGTVDASEKGLRSIEAKLASVMPGDDVFALSQAHQEGQRAAAAALAEWTELSLRLEQLQGVREQGAGIGDQRV